MEADFAVELGSDDETLEIPWDAGGHGPRYYDLKRHPEGLQQVVEAQEFPALGEFLAAINSSGSILESAKCDAWFTTELNPEEEIFGVAGKFGSYVDLFFSDDRKFEFVEHEQFARRLAQLLQQVPEIPAAAEILIRRAYYRQPPPTRSGFYFTFYLFGYGENENEARKQWSIALKLVENAIRQVSGGGQARAG